MIETFPTIAIVPTDKLIPHEWHDNQRTPPLIAKLEASGMMKNPPIIAPFNDGSGRYMVLDGANRTTALYEMGFPHTIAQVVEPDGAEVDLTTWNHVCWGISPKDFIDGIEAVSDVTIETIEPGIGLRELYHHNYLALVQLPGEKIMFAVTHNADTLVERVNLLNKIVDSYKTRTRLDRTRVRQINALAGIYENLSGLIVFPPFKIQQVLDLCGAGHLFPPGVTRFSVAPRALRLNFPLDTLRNDDDIETKNNALKKWIQAKIASKEARFYAEPTILFDE